jgi:hypothetical protein
VNPYIVFTNRVSGTSGTAVGPRVPVSPVFNTSSTEWSTVTLPMWFNQAGTVLLGFAGLNSGGGDETVVIDDVQLFIPTPNGRMNHHHVGIIAGIEPQQLHITVLGLDCDDACVWKSDSEVDGSQTDVSSGIDNDLRRETFFEVVFSFEKNLVIDGAVG